MMRMESNGRNLVCRNCLERKTTKDQAYQVKMPVENKISKAPKSQANDMKEYFCKECRYNFSRADHLSITRCPYCGTSGSVMNKSSTARIVADSAKMKGDF